MWVVYSNTVRDSPPHTYTCVYSIICIYLNKINLIADSDIVLPLIMFILCMMLLELYFPFVLHCRLTRYNLQKFRYNHGFSFKCFACHYMVDNWNCRHDYMWFPKAQNMILQTKTNVSSDIRTHNTTQSISTNPYHPTSSDVKTVLHVI